MHRLSHHSGRGRSRAGFLDHLSAVPDPPSIFTKKMGALAICEGSLHSLAAYMRAFRMTGNPLAAQGNPDGWRSAAPPAT
jgi:hypothetical protein